MEGKMAKQPISTELGELNLNCDIRAIDDYGREIIIESKKALRVFGARDVSKFGTVLLAKVKNNCIAIGCPIFIRSNNKEIQDEIASLEIERERINIALANEKVGICLRNTDIYYLQNL